MLEQRNALKLPKIHDTEEYTALLFREAKCVC